MMSPFLRDTGQALRALQRAQAQRARQDEQARQRLDAAQRDCQAALARTAVMEARAWRALLDVPGMTARTAAELGGVSVATVHRRAKEGSDV